MPAIKAKQVRLIDALSIISESEVVTIIYNHGRSSYTNTTKAVELDFKNELSKEVKGLSCSSGVVTIYM